MRDLLFSVRARDLTAAAFSQVRKGLAGVNGAFATAAERAGRYGDKLVGLGGILAGLAAGPVLAFSDSLSAWDAQEQAVAKVEQAVKRTGGAAGFSADELQRQAKALSDVSKFGDQDILGQVTSSLLTFGNVTGDVFTRAQTAVADMSTVLGTDLQGLAMTLGEALDSPAEGLSALGEAGIVFTAAQTDLVKKLVETGDTAAAQGVILDEVARRFGGQAAAAAEAGMGPLVQWQNTWIDLKETVGGVVASLLPPVTKALSGIADLFQGLPEPMQRAIVGFVGATAALGALAMVAGAAAVALAPLTLPFIAIGAAIAGAIALVVAFWPEIQKLGAVASEVFAGFKLQLANMMQAGVEMVVGGVNTYISTFQGGFDAIKAIWANLPGSIGGFVSLAANGLIAGVEFMVNQVVRRINKFITDINGVLAMLPEWAAPEGGLSLSVIGEVTLPRLENAEAEAAATAASDAFNAAFARQAFEVPDLGLKAMADNATRDLINLQAGPLPTLDALSGAADGVGASATGAADALGGLGDALGGSGGSGGVAGAAKSAGAGLSSVKAGAKDATSGLDALLFGLGEAEGTLDGFGRETTDMFKGMFGTGRQEFESFGDFVTQWGNKFLDRVMSSLFDPLGDALQTLMNGMMSGGLGGGAGGGFFAGIGNALGGLMGFDTGGEMAVAGRAGIDRNVASFRVTQGETIKVTKRGEGGGDRPVNVYIQTPDPAAFKASRGQVAAGIARAVGHANRFT